MPADENRFIREIKVLIKLYRVVQKWILSFIFLGNFGNSAPILTILPLLQA